MNIIRTKDYDRMSKAAGDIVGQIIQENPTVVLGLPTGETPVGLYAHLVEFYQRGLDFSGVTTFNLDEYVGLAADHPQSFHTFMNRHLFDHVNICRDNINIPNGVCKDLEAECRRYEQALAQAGGIDLMVVGVGANGHIGFNEPQAVLPFYTAVVDLAPETIRINAAKFFAGDTAAVPTKAITMGIGSIMKARKILLLASGESKRNALKSGLLGGVTTANPVSILFTHPDITLVVDEDAWGGLANMDYISVSPQ